MSIRKKILSITAPYCLALEKSVGAVVYRYNEGRREYFVLRYPHGHWEFPRGHVEEGETEEETMYREVWEETSFTKDMLDVQEGFRESFAFSYRARGDEYKERAKQRRCIFIRKKVVFFVAELVTPNVPVEECGKPQLSEEHVDYDWLTFESVQKRLTHQNARTLIGKVEKFLHERE